MKLNSILRFFIDNCEKNTDQGQGQGKPYNQTKSNIMAQSK